jgi:L-arabinose isomerase
MIERKNKRIARIGIFAVVHDTYYSQFDGLQEKLEGYHQDLVRSLKQHDITLIDYGFASGQQNAAAIAAQMRRDDLDLIFCNMATYATSATFAPVVLGAEQPIILLALQPRAAMDYSQASTRKSAGGAI